MLSKLVPLRRRPFDLNQLPSKILTSRLSTTTRCVSSAFELEPQKARAIFHQRHIGPSTKESVSMLKYCGFESMDKFIDQVIPEQIRLQKRLDIDDAIDENEMIEKLHDMMSQNSVWRTYIGQGYYGTHTPAIIQRNVFENPAWYTPYTPYQPEISQGRLEALFNFQTMVSELTGFEITNSSLLDEGTAAAEAMVLAHRVGKGDTFVVDSKCHPQTISVVQTRARPLGINLKVIDFSDKGQVNESLSRKVDGCLLQYPDTEGSLNVEKVQLTREQMKKTKGLTIVATDLLALTMTESPASLGADAAIGTSQRFGVPMGFGGPHAAFLSAKKHLARQLPGRIVGLSKDQQGNPAFRLALQAREQHIRRDKATSNICTAQALLANMAGFYALYHGSDGLRDIANRVHGNTIRLAAALLEANYQLANTGSVFDTIKVGVNSVDAIRQRANEKQINLRYYADSSVGISLDETLRPSDFDDLLYIFSAKQASRETIEACNARHGISDKSSTARSTPFLSQPLFNSFHSENSLMRYIKRLEQKDVSLVHSMIPLGSCTMKLNASAEMQACSWPSVNRLHPFCPQEQSRGYAQLLDALEHDLAELTGFELVSLTPNSGAQGEYTGLCMIKAYLNSIGQTKRNVCLIPTSAHGTNPASAKMAGFEVQPVQTTRQGRIDVANLKTLLDKHKENIGAIMITYPSTFGLYEAGIDEVCKLVHECGGQVYLDGANMNAQLGLCRPGDYGADVCHLNLHKTFAIPHGGGGPGVGPVCAKSHLAAFMPPTVHEHPIGMDDGHPLAVCSAPYGSASILPISWAYIKLLGSRGLRQSSQQAMLNANYMLRRLSDHFTIRFKGDTGLCAHEFLLDCTPFERHNIEVIDIAKRLIDYGFHSPTMSWPVVGNLMIEPTESEPLDELDRFCDALISIRMEIDKIANGTWDKSCNPLKMAPHTLEIVSCDVWDRPYGRKEGGLPAPWHNGTTGTEASSDCSKRTKVWPTVSRLDDVYGDKNLFCSWSPEC